MLFGYRPKTEPGHPVTAADGYRLHEIFERIVVQGSQDENLIVLFRILIRVAAEEFREDNAISLISWMLERFDDAAAKEVQRHWGHPKKFSCLPEEMQDLPEERDR